MNRITDPLKRLWRSGCAGKIAALAILLFLLACPCVLLSTLSPSRTPTPAPPTSAPVASDPTARASPVATHTIKPTEVVPPTATSTPKPVPTATHTLRPTLKPTDSPVPTPIPQPITLSGSGQTATRPFDLPGVLCIARFTHQGASNFIVTAYQGNDKKLLINKIGSYAGSRPLAGEQPITLDIQADGPWTVRIDPISSDGSPPFAGQGDSVSPLFSPPQRDAWLISHNGGANFIVYLHCASGSTLVQNEIGVVQASTVIAFGKGPCFWEVQADGGWSLSPR